MDNRLNLKWNPWIGKNYSSSKKVLILGDSHYEDGDYWQEDNLEVPSILINKHIANPKAGDFYGKIERLVLNKDEVSDQERVGFWDSVIYTNLIQRLLPSKMSEDRPNDADFDEGWKTIFEFCNIYKPRYCVKFGKDGSGRIGALLTNKHLNWIHDKEEFYNDPRVLNLSKDGNDLRIMVINHPTGSRGFDMSKWKKVIADNLS
jgi:hypothetical protein